jgi:hypothetical protein
MNRMGWAALFRLYKTAARSTSNSYSLTSNLLDSCQRYEEAAMSVYRAYIMGLHDRSIGVVQLDCLDDEAAIKSAGRLVDSHDVELWQMDRPVARFDARSGQMCRK